MIRQRNRSITRSREIRDRDCRQHEERVRSVSGTFYFSSRLPPLCALLVRDFPLLNWTRVSLSFFFSPPPLTRMKRAVRADKAVSSAREERVARFVRRELKKNRVILRTGENKGRRGDARRRCNVVPRVAH